MNAFRVAPIRDRALQLVEKYSEANVPTAHGMLRVVVFRDRSRRAGGEPLEHVAIIAGDVSSGDAPVPVRVHSECWTGEVLGSLKCDCGPQLDHALELIAREGRGVVLYLRQEGRGIGLGNKIRAYALQEQGVDTVDANRALGFADDARTYDGAACMLKQLGVKHVLLITNKPAKIEAMGTLGIDVVGRIPSLVETNEHSAEYLETKRVRMGHLLERHAEPVADPVRKSQTRFV